MVAPRLPVGDSKHDQLSSRFSVPQSFGCAACGVPSVENGHLMVPPAHESRVFCGAFPFFQYIQLTVMGILQTMAQQWGRTGGNINSCTRKDHSFLVGGEHEDDPKSHFASLD